jgi:predicted aldo/keto reductase-like oxidoreductase
MAASMQEWNVTEMPNVAGGTGLTRRDFVKSAIAAGVMLGTGAGAWAAGDQSGSQETETRNGVPYRTLGRTGERISAIGLGGYHIGIPPEEEGIRIIRTAIDQGINFMDNCWDYHEGGSEVRMGKALRDGYRNKVFLMTKIDGRTRSAAAAQIDQCLQRLQTDRVDLMQHHEILRMEDPDRVFAPDGATEAMAAAQKAGKLRFIGFTGHKDPLVHLRMLEVAAAHGFRFDAVQMPLNVMDAHFRSFERQVVPLLVKEGIGVLGMKPLGSGHILRTKAVKPVECLHYAMSLQTSTVITGCDKMEILQQALEAARSFKALSREDIARLLARTAPLAATGKFEPFKTTAQFDGTAHNPRWLGG